MAIELYRDKANMDCHNSVKESVSAVKATYRWLTEREHKDSCGTIAKLERDGVYLPKSSKNRFAAIYGKISGKDGIRHALMVDAHAKTVTEAKARHMLVMCTAYMNFLLSLRGKSKLGP